MKYINLTINILLLLSSINVFADGLPEDANSSVNYMDEYSNSNKTSKPTSIIDKSSVALSSETLAKYQYCGKDSDCIAVINGCCQCLQGDKFVAIAKDMLEAFKSNFRCEDYKCGKEESNKNCSDGVVSCINHKCSYFDASQ